MILLNFAHPLTPDHIRQIEDFTGEKVKRVIEIHTQIDLQQPLVPQVTALADEAGLSPAEWQTLTLLVNPPSLNHIAVALLAELHGRCGYFPAHLRMCSKGGSVQYKVAEILDLQAVRDAARRKRN